MREYPEDESVIEEGEALTMREQALKFLPNRKGTANRSPERPRNAVAGSLRQQNAPAIMICPGGADLIGSYVGGVGATDSPVAGGAYGVAATGVSLAWPVIGENLLETLLGKGGTALRLPEDGGGDRTGRGQGGA